MNRRRDSRGRFAKAVAEVGLEEYKDEVGNYRGDNGGDNRDNRGGFFLRIPLFHYLPFFLCVGWFVLSSIPWFFIIKSIVVFIAKMVVTDMAYNMHIIVPNENQANDTKKWPF